MSNTVKGYFEPSSTNVHSNIDDLILQAKLDEFDMTGVMYKQPENPIDVVDSITRDFVEGLLPIGKIKNLGRVIAVPGGKYKWISDKVVRKQIDDSKLADSYKQEMKKLNNFIKEKGLMGYATNEEMIKAKRKIKQIRNLYDELVPAIKGRNIFQQGGAVTIASYYNR